VRRTLVGGADYCAPPSRSVYDPYWSPGGFVRSATMSENTICRWNQVRRVWSGLGRIICDPKDVRSTSSLPAHAPLRKRQVYQQLTDASEHENLSVSNSTPQLYGIVFRKALCEQAPSVLQHDIRLANIIIKLIWASRYTANNILAHWRVVLIPAPQAWYSSKMPKFACQFFSAAINAAEADYLKWQQEQSRRSLR
jgi:hypothetical protein